MKSLLTIFAVILALMSPTLYAGDAGGRPVEIDLNNGVAEGTMWATRSSDNDVEVNGLSHPLRHGDVRDSDQRQAIGQPPQQREQKAGRLVREDAAAAREVAGP